MEWCFFVEVDRGCVASEHIFGIESLELGVPLIFGQQLREGYVVRAVVAEEPNVGLLRLVEHALEGRESDPLSSFPLHG